MESTGTLTTIFSHNRWANIRLLERCAGLTKEQLDATISGAYGSIRDTLQHIVRAEQSYFSRISTGQPRPYQADEPDLSIEEMMESSRITGLGLIDWSTKVAAEDTVILDWDGTAREVPKTIILNQVINHATEHRAQVMAIMTQIGIEPPDLQSWSYFDELDS